MFGENIISKANIGKPVEWFRKATGSPLGAAATLAGTAGLAAYMAAPAISSFGAEHIAKMLPADAAREVLENEQKNRQAMRWKIALALGGLAGGASLLSDISPNQKNYGLTSWKTDPMLEPSTKSGEALGIRMDQQPTNKPPQTQEHVKNDWHWQPPVQKTAAFEDEYFKRLGWQESGDRYKLQFGGDNYASIINSPTIPIAFSRDLIGQDPHMTVDERRRVQEVIDRGSMGKPFGMMSTSDLVHGGVNMGLGYVGGSIVGGFLGNVLGLPPVMVKALSVGGGLAAGLRNTNLI